MPLELSPAPTGIINGWWPMYDDATLVAWKRSGDAASVGGGWDVLASHDHDEALVRVHHVKTLDEYLATVEAYRAFAKQQSISTETFDHTLTCLFRGQTRDYVDDGGVFISKPTAFRSAPSAAEYLSRELDTPMARDWGRWAKVIGQVIGVDDSSGQLYSLSDPLQPDRHIAPRRTNRNLSERLTTNLELMALAMHYGFPTASLDVTPDENVALWFALNVGGTDADGRIRYEPNVGTPATDEGPSVYVYIQRHSVETPVVDLTAGALTRERASRPFVQRAWALPFYLHALQWGGDMDGGFGQVSGPSLRWPSAIIKPVFEPEVAARARTTYDAAELFPVSDPLYSALMDADVPRLARYAL